MHIIRATAVDFTAGRSKRADNDKEEKMGNIRINPDLDGDGQIKQWEWDLTTQGLKKDKDYEVSVDGQKYTGNLDRISNGLRGKIIANAGSPKSPQEILKFKMEDLAGTMEALKQQIETAKQQGQEAQVKQLQEQLRQQVMLAERYNAYAVKKMELGSFKNAAGLMESEYQFDMKAQTFSGGAQTQSSAKAATFAGGTTVSYPAAGWGAGNFSAQVDPSAAYTQALAMENNVMSAWDSINQNTQQGRRLMMLFFYFAKMAESGDMGAMYQFMKFITYIITKDKAKQQIEMSKKVIQMQELSRQITNKMYQIPVAPNDPNYSNELMKTMTMVKSETDSLATSQKLASQMMEEFAQVSEVLHNVLRSTVDSYKRISNTVSRPA